jgi:hypothetical protein
MSARFAGSRHLDERRRRRLAVESEEASADSSRSTTTAASSLARSAPAAPGLTHFPLRKVISSRRWKLWLVVLAVTLCASALVSAGTAAARPDVPWPAAAATLLSQAGPVQKTFSGTLLLVSAQLAVVVWWARSRSAGDYGGRYRIWMWAAVTLFVWAFCLASGVHALAGEAAQERWPLDVPAAATLYWLAPAAAWLLVMLRGIDRELVRCRSSRCCLWLGALASAASAGLLAVPDFTVPHLDRPILEAALALASPVLIFAAVVHHARHVIYITPEAPPPVTSLWRHALAMLRFAARLVARPALRRTKGEANAAESRGPAPPKSGSTREPRTRTQAAAARPTRPTLTREPIVEPLAEDLAEDVSDDEDESEPAGEQSAAPAGPAAGKPTLEDAPAQVRIDEPVDKNLLKGLSKRQRRELRKQLKDERRRAAQDT